MAEIGEPIRRITIEPIPEQVPEPIPEPVPEEVPA